MRWLKTAAAEVFGLFVDDGTFAVAILVWATLAVLMLPWLDIASGMKGPALAIGLAGILIVSAARRARR